MTKVFVSHAGLDQAWAMDIAAWLKEMGYEIILDALHFLPGQNFMDDMHHAEDEADLTVCLISPNFLASDYSMQELFDALAQDPLGHKPKMIPVLIEDTHLPAMLKPIIYIDLRKKEKPVARAQFERAMLAVQQGSYENLPEVAPIDFAGLVVLFANFERISGTQFEPGKEWVLYLRNQLAEFAEQNNVLFLGVNVTVQNESAAKNLLKLYGATFIVWGSISPNKIEVNYTYSDDLVAFRVLPDKTYKQSDDGWLSSILEKSVAHPSSFKAYITNGGDLEYLLYVVLGLTLLTRIREDHELLFFAQDYFLKAIEIVPKKREKELCLHVVYYYLSMAQLDRRESIFCLTRALAINPKLIEAYRERAYHELMINRFKEAVADCDKAIGINSQFGEAYFMKGLAFFKQRRFQEAVENYTRAIDLGTNRGDLYNARGAAYYAIKNYLLALEDQVEAVNLNPKVAQFHLNVGQNYSQLALFSDAVREFTVAISLQPEWDSPYSNRCAAYLKLGRACDALVDLRKFLQLTEDHDPAFQELLVTLTEACPGSRTQRGGSKQRKNKKKRR